MLGRKCKMKGCNVCMYIHITLTLPLKLSYPNLTLPLTRTTVGVGPHNMSNTHKHLCCWLAASSGDTQTDYTFVHLAVLSRRTFLNTNTCILILIQNLKPLRLYSGAGFAWVLTLNLECKQRLLYELVKNLHCLKIQNKARRMTFLFGSSLWCVI